MGASRNQWTWLLALLAAGITCGMWYYVNYVLVPYEVTYAKARNVPRGNLSDLYPRWLGTRELLLHGRNPYSKDITRESQIGFYGRPLNPGSPTDPKDQEAFAYPVYVVFLLAPLANLSFTAAQNVFRVLAFCMTVASIPLWTYALGLRWRRADYFIAMLLLLGTFQFVQGYKLQQFSVLIAFLVSAILASLRRGRLTLAGFLLALAAVKPQVIAVLVPWLVLWTLGEWKQRRKFLIAFSLTMASLLAASEVVLPHWLLYFRAAISEYVRYTQGKSVLAQFFGPVGPLIALGLLAWLAVLCWRFRRLPADSGQFTQLSVFVLAVTLVAIPEAVPHIQLVLLGALLLPYSQRVLFRNSIVYWVCLLPFAPLSWSWISAVALSLSGRWLPQTPSVWGVLPLLGTNLVPLAILIAMLPALLMQWQGQSATQKATA